MVRSPLEKVREIADPAILVVLTDFVGGAVVSSSCDDDRATKVDSTGLTTINMLLIMCNASHLIITQYQSLTQS